MRSPFLGDGVIDSHFDPRGGQQRFEQLKEGLSQAVGVPAGPREEPVEGCPMHLAGDAGSHTRFGDAAPGRGITREEPADDQENEANERGSRKMTAEPGQDGGERGKSRGGYGGRPRGR